MRDNLEYIENYRSASIYFDAINKIYIAKYIDIIDEDGKFVIEIDKTITGLKKEIDDTEDDVNKTIEELDNLDNRLEELRREMKIVKAKIRAIRTEY